MIQIPRRIRLYKACHAHLYSEVKEKLATDKEIRALRHLDKKVSDYYVRVNEQKRTLKTPSRADRRYL
jgi:hypothetical protein